MPGRIAGFLGGLIGGFALMGLAMLIPSILSAGFAHVLTVIGAVAAGLFAIALIIVGIWTVFDHQES
jgi:uncharacterized membrane protein YqjE